jgi:septation ring formation regulator EzrA
MDTIDKELEQLRGKQDAFSDILTSLNLDKMENIKQVIAEINDLIAERKFLSSSLINAYEGLLSRINSIIARTPQENLKEEIILHEKAVQVEEAKIGEHLNCWRDIAKLKEELREVLREFREQESVQNSYDELLNN